MRISIVDYGNRKKKLTDVVKHEKGEDVIEQREHRIIPFSALDGETHIWNKRRERIGSDT